MKSKNRGQRRKIRLITLRIRASLVNQNHELLRTNEELRIEGDQLRRDVKQLMRDKDRLQSQLIEAGPETKCQLHYWKGVAKTYIAMAEQFRAEMTNPVASQCRQLTHNGKTPQSTA